MNDTEHRLRHLLAQAAPDLGAIDPDTLLAPRPQHSRRPRLIAVAASVAVIAAVAVAVSVVGHSDTSERPAAAAPSVDQPTIGSVPVSQPSATGVPVGLFPNLPASVFDAVGAPPQLSRKVKKLVGPELTANGKPEVLYVGADWAPYDAAQRWALAAALSRFGTLTDLGQTASKIDDGDLATVSFHGASYASDDITAVLKDIQDRSEKPLDKLTASEQKLFTTVSGGSVPFIDIAGRYKIVGAQYDPAILKGLSQAQIAGALSDPSSPVAKAIIGSANVLTAAICDATGDRPATTCHSEAATAAKRLLNTSLSHLKNTKGNK